MAETVAATYTEITRGNVTEVPELIDRIISSEIPAFVIANTGGSLREALKVTGIEQLLRASGYDGDVRTSVDFVHNRGVLPSELADVPYPQGEDWADIGVTALHTDKHDSEQAEQFSLNHTRAGRSDFRLHRSRLTPEQLYDQWDVLDTLTGDILWHSRVNPDLISPEGHRTILCAGDLLVFDPANAHIVRSLETPRLSEATFFDRVSTEVLASR